MKLSTCMLVMIALFPYCAKKEPEFFKLNLATHPFVEQPDSLNNKTLTLQEVYVIAAPPGNPEKLRNIVDVFNSKTLRLPDSIQHYRYYRLFYKETRKTPCNYKEDDRSGDDILNHSNDLLLEIEWGNSECGNHIHYNFYRNGNIWDDKSFSVVHKKNCK